MTSWCSVNFIYIHKIRAHRFLSQSTNIRTFKKKRIQTTIHKIRAHSFLTNQVLSPKKKQKTNIHTRFDPLRSYKKKAMDQFIREFAANNNETTLRYWTVPLLHQNLRGATLSNKDIPTSPYTKGENNKNNIVSS